MTDAYTPGQPPASLDSETAQWLAYELQQIACALREGDKPELFLETQGAAPAKLVDGMIMFSAAGVLGAGAGTYERVGGAWVKL